MKKIMSIFSFLTLSCFSHSADFSAIDQYVVTNKEKIKLESGTAIAIVKGDELVYEGYFGYSDIAAKKQVNENTVFYIASMTKAFYSLLTLLKENKGELDTNETLDKLFPNSEFKTALQANSVTIQSLLAHTSGLDNWPLVQVTAYTGDYDTDLITKLINASKVNEDAPSGQFEYTNVGYNVLSHWMDKQFQTPWQTLLQQEIFQPLGMEQSSARMSDISKNNWDYAKGYSVKSDNPNKPVYLTKTDSSMHAAGGMLSTAKDLSRFLIALMNKGQMDGKQVLPESVIEKSQQTLVSAKEYGRDIKYGWGWYVRELNGRRLLEHRGGYAGASTYMSFMPDEKIAVVVLNNQDKWGGDLAYAVEKLAYSISLGQTSEQVTEIVTDYEQFVDKNVEKFYSNKTAKSPAITKDLAMDIVGTYYNELLGKITLTKSADNGYFIKWGNLESQLYSSDEPNHLAVEFVPTRRQAILFLTGSNDETYLEFKDYRFLKSK